MKKLFDIAALILLSILLWITFVKSWQPSKKTDEWVNGYEAGYHAAIEQGLCSARPVSN